MSLESVLSRNVSWNRVPVFHPLPLFPTARASSCPSAFSNTDTANSRFKRDSREIEIDCSTWSVTAGSAARDDWREETLDSVRVPCGRMRREESTGQTEIDK